MSLGSEHDGIKGFIKIGNITLIATPYRKGRHFATRPTDFVPIIDHLKELHDDGFVHGDIRANNMVFGERGEDGAPNGWLIDFDFGGKAGNAVYPPGYNRALSDGQRMGRGGKSIEKWHDWWALANIIFFFHTLEGPRDSLKLKTLDLKGLWNDLKKDEDITDGKVMALQNFLRDIEKCQWTVAPSQGFQDELELGKSTKIGTRPGATGSPPQKK